MKTRQQKNLTSLVKCKAVAVPLQIALEGQFIIVLSLSVLLYLGKEKDSKLHMMVREFRKIEVPCYWLL